MDLTTTHFENWILNEANSDAVASGKYGIIEVSEHGDEFVPKLITQDEFSNYTIAPAADLENEWVSKAVENLPSAYIFVNRKEF